MVPFGGPCSAHVSKSLNFTNGGRSNPWLAATSCWIASRVERCASRLLAAALFLENIQMPARKGVNETKRPFGPFGIAKVQHCSATAGASRLATAQALGPLRISAPRPEISQRLLEASSHATVSGGRNA